MAKDMNKSQKISVNSKKRINHRAVFKARTKIDDDAELSYRMIITARKTGQLNMSSRGLATVPSKVWTINDLTNEEIEELRVNMDFEDDRDHWWEQEPLQILNLSSNSLTNVDAKIEYLAELRDLNLHNNLLEELPQEIGSLAKLRKLDLSHNKLNDLHPKFYNLSELRYLNLANNKIEKLSPSIGDLVMLETLNLSCNHLTELPVGMGYLVRLVSLDLSHNQLEKLPPDIMSMRVLKRLDASFNNLEVVPPLGEMRKVEAIVLHNNKLPNFPDLTGCTALRELDLANNDITEIEMSYLEDMGQLRILRLDSNKIKEIPEDIVKLLNLERFDLSCNELSNIPSFVSIMPNLKYFGIEGNDVKNVRRDIIQCGAPRILRHLRQSFDTTNIESIESCSPVSNIVKFPDKYVMRSTKLLSMTGQNLNEVPDSVIEDASSVEVTCIDLSRNRLRELPDKLSTIKTATDLKLMSNQLTTVPEWLGEQLIHLRFLDLSQNCLTTLPSSIGELDHLQEINISFNRFTKVPESIYNIIRLEILIANDNQISDIDEVALRKLQRLATLDLSNNNIGHVPPELGNHRHLRLQHFRELNKQKLLTTLTYRYLSFYYRNVPSPISKKLHLSLLASSTSSSWESLYQLTLQLTGNCFKQPRHTTLMKGAEEILSYLRDRIPT